VYLRSQYWNLLKLLRAEVPGCENMKLEQPSVRAMSCNGQHRLDGEVFMTGDHLWNKTWDDSIAVSNSVPDIYCIDGKSHYCVDVGILPYEVPYRAIVAKKYKNLLCPGNAMSVSFTVRTCMSHVVQSIQTGQAAGTASALAVKNGTTPKELNVRLLQDQLRRDGAVVKLDQISRECMDMYRERSRTLKAQEQ